MPLASLQAAEARRQRKEIAFETNTRRSRLD